jgi:hypothetical protein
LCDGSVINAPTVSVSFNNMNYYRAIIIICLFALFFGLDGCDSFGLPSRAKEVISSSSANSDLRRQFIISSIPIITLGLPAEAAETTAEAIRLISSKTIPGLGPPDIYYPPNFVGRWKTTRVISSSDDVFFKELQDRGVKLPIQVTSEMRFVPYNAGKDFQQQETNPDSNTVPAIADRSFNEKSYYAALSEEIGRLYQQSSTKSSLPSIQRCDWTPTNPNVLALEYSDGSSKEIKVTKRSSDVSNDGSNLFSSEFRRITVVPPSSSSSITGGIPSVYKSRVLTKWRQVSGSNDVIEGIEILYNEQGTLGDRNSDPLQMGSNGVISSLYGGDSKDLADWRTTKTKILMERMK